LLRDANRLRTSGYRVKYNKGANAKDCNVEVPAQDIGKDDRRGINGNARSHPALEQKEKRSEHPRFYIEAPFQEFISRVNIQAVIQGEYKNSQDDHRQRQPEIKLREAHPVVISLTGCG